MQRLLAHAAQTVRQSYWDTVCKRNCTAGVNDAETLFAALKAHHVQQQLPYAIYQLDTCVHLRGGCARSCASPH